MSRGCAGIILSGGLNRRMSGRNKAFLMIQGRSFLDIIVRVVRSCFQECVLSTRNPSEYGQVDLKVVRDILPFRGSMTGIHAGLNHIRAEFGFCTACDTPFLKKDVIKILADEIESGVDVVVPASGSYFQPLCAVYSRRCAGLIEKQLLNGDPKVDHLFDQLNVKKVPYERIRSVDPELVSFFNINSPQDLEIAQQIIPEHRPSV